MASLSLPLILPPTTDLLRTHHLRHSRADSPPPRNGSEQQQLHNRNAHNNSTSSTKKHPSNNPILTPHALLLADEATIQHRKAAIRNFGANWIRPPGVSKTLQAMREEEAEMLEQEELSRQEQGLRDLRARQEVEEARNRAQEAAVGDEGDVVGERDLDDEIPDADAVVAGDGDGMGEVEEDDVTFNEDSIMVEGSRLVHEGHEQEQAHRHHAALILQEEAELTGAARDEEELGIEHEERDLDDSVPEAGSYQHTDTEVEDSSSSAGPPSSSSDDEDGEADGARGGGDRDAEGASELHDSFAARSAQRARRPGQDRQRHREQDQGSGGVSTAFQSSLQERMRAQIAGGRNGGGGGEDALTRSPGSLNLSSSLLESSFVGSSPVMLRGRGGSGIGRRRGRLS